MHFWQQNIGGTWLRDLAQSLSIESDVSDTNYGGFMMKHGCYVAHGAWSADERLRSSTWKELKATWMVRIPTAQAPTSKEKIVFRQPECCSNNRCRE